MNKIETLLKDRGWTKSDSEWIKRLESCNISINFEDSTMIIRIHHDFIKPDTLIGSLVDVASESFDRLYKEIMRNVYKYKSIC